MKPGRGKSKGNSFENKVGRIISLWGTEGADKTQLIPSRLSGGWKDAAWRHAGDLAPNGPWGEHFRLIFVTELKHHRKELLWCLFSNKKGVSVQKWWTDLTVLATTVGRLPLLIYRQNSKPIILGMPEDLIHCGSVPDHLHKLLVPRYKLALTPLQAFVESVDSRAFCAEATTLLNLIARRAAS